MPSSALLCCLIFLAGVGASQDEGTQSKGSCTLFPANLPHMLQELRAAFSRVKTFFQMKDELDNMLLNGSLLEDFKGYLGCQALSEMIQFYLEEVMPQAENHGPDIKEHVNSLGEKLKTLRLRLRQCVSRRPVLSLAAPLFFPKHHLLTRFTPETHTRLAGALSGRRWSSIFYSFLSMQGVGWLLGIYM
ncbi:PREDICTED: interleukin-10 isoform X1 [Ceratotherium simum simum]|uniref:Interleukin family protein n=1 Tax=Ceratotherium simum simum TaxID=73337 RepID=A0ABM1CHB8_CERSS|nr:PREDICTED: interleukin-10 isoform X1 [Ceratotherium simum simum]